MLSFSFRSITLALVASVLCASTMATAIEQQQPMTRELRAEAAKFTAEMLQAVNAERTKQGLAPLCTNKKLEAAAQLHSEDQATNNFMDHTSSDGRSAEQRVVAQGFNSNGVSENVAAGQTDVAAVMASWMGSSGHRANIFSNSKFFGLGYAYNAAAKYKHYWTQVFSSGSGEVCDGGAANTPPASTPAPDTKAPVTQAPVTQAPPMYTPRPVGAPRPSPTQPSATPTEPTVTPAPSNEPTVTPAPSHSRKRRGHRGHKDHKKSHRKPSY